MCSFGSPPGYPISLPQRHANPPPYHGDVVEEVTGVSTQGPAPKTLLSRNHRWAPLSAELSSIPGPSARSQGASIPCLHARIPCAVRVRVRAVYVRRTCSIRGPPRPRTPRPDGH